MDNEDMTLNDWIDGIDVANAGASVIKEQVFHNKEVPLTINLDDVASRVFDAMWALIQEKTVKNKSSQLDKFN